MFKKIKKILSRFFQSRSVILSILLVLMGFVLIRRLFDLQIINGESYQDNYNLQITRETTIPSTRGCIYDSDGNLLAYNKLAYDVTFQDVGSYETTREKNLTINGYLYQIMQILYTNGDDVYTDFAIKINDAGEYEYTKSGTNLLRFRADVYGQADPADMKPYQKSVSAEDMVKELGGDGDYGFGVVSESLEKPYTAAELEQYGLPDTLSQEDALKIIAMRSAINQNNYQKYISTTSAKDISDKSMSSLMESKGYYVSVYSYASFLNTKLDASIFEDYDIWVAHFGVSSPSFSKAKYGMWQYSSTGSVSGISGNVDMDYSYQCYPNIMLRAKLNGF